MNTELEKIKNELEELRANNARISQMFDEKINFIKSDISEVAIDKTLSILSHIRNWILLIGLFITALAFFFGFLGIKNIGENLSSHFKTEMEKWLRFEPHDGPAKAKLEEIRTQAILDAYTIKLSRSKAGPYGVRNIELNTLEQERLLEILLEPKTTYGDFIDALRLITSSRGIIRLWHPEDDAGKKIVNMLQDEAYSPEKKGQILCYMRDDQSLLPYAKSILSHPANSDSVKSQAFKNVALFDEVYSNNYAVENLPKLPDSMFKIDLAEHLAKNNPKASELSSYIETLKEEKKEHWQRNLLTIAQAMIGGTTAAKQDGFDVVVKELAFLIDNGAKITISDSSFGPRYLTFALIADGSTYYSGLEEPSKFLSNKKLFNTLINSRPDSFDWLKKVIKSFEIEEFGFYFTTLLVDLGQDTVIKLADGKVITKNEITGKGWLRMEKVADNEFPVFIWRDKTGQVLKGMLTSIKNTKEAEFEISFDRKTIDSISARNLNNDMWSW